LNRQTSRPYLLTVLMIFSSLALNAQNVVINELLASNTADFPEMYDFGDYNDWLELYNPTDLTQDLSGYFLSDDSEDPLKWLIPNNTQIDAHEYLLIWADDFNEGPGAFYQRATWPWESYTTRHYHTNFKLNLSGEQVVLASADHTAEQTLIPEGALWKYLDEGSDQGILWTETDFDDAAWNAGPAELGYGDGDEATLLSYGPDSDDKYITTYFRHLFPLANSANIQNLSLLLKRDDGAVIHINGNEVLRVNMPAGQIAYDTPASSAVADADEDAFFEFSLSGSELVDGSNVIAVEIHQVSHTSSDISFDLELTGHSYSGTEIVDVITYGPQTTDVSYGRDLGGASWYYYGQPTPGSANLTNPSSTMTRSGSISASLESGFYSGPQTVLLECDSESDQIFYTLDGSRPGESTSLYTGPILLENTVVLKARSIAVDRVQGAILTASYLIDEPSHISSVSLVAEPATLWDSDIGIYENEYKQREIPVTVEYFTPETEHGFTVKSGSRLGGQNIWTKPQKPFTIYQRNRFGDDQIHYQLFQGKPITNFSRIVFRNGGDDWEETLIRDPMTQSLVTGMMDCGYMAYSPTALFLNGTYWGIHNIREKFNDQYFYENFNADPDNYDHLEYTSTPAGTQMLVVVGNFVAYESLIDFVLSNDLNQTDNYAELLQLMNVDGFIDHLVMTLYCANTSWGHNREWWRPGTDGGKWQWLIVDLDRGFNPDNINNNLVDNLMNSYLLFQYLLSSSRFEERFVQRAAAHINNTFQTERVIGIVDSLSNIISPEIPRHAALWGSQGGVSSVAAWENELDNIRDFAQQRPAILFNQFNNTLDLDGTVQVSVTIDPPGSGRILMNDVPLINPTGAGLYFQNRLLTLHAQPATGYQFLGWEAVSDSAAIEYNCFTDSSFTAVFQLSGEIILPGLISENTTLTNTQPYVVVHDLIVQDGVTLTVSAGVELRMPEAGSIIIQGQLEILGTETYPVKIIPNPSIGENRWGAMVFSNATDTSHIQYAQISGASSGPDPIIHIAAISSINSNTIIEHIQIENVEFPIYIEGGSTQIRNSSIASEYVCDYINVKYGDVIIENCSFYGAHAPDTDAIDLDGVIGGIIRNNRIYNFQGDNSDGIDVGEWSQDVMIASNLIYHSSDKGISLGQCSSIIIDRNVIVGCGRAIAIKDSADALISNNTLFNNDTSISCYEKNVGAGGGTAEIVNTIMAGSSNAPVFTDVHSSASIRYSLSDYEQMSGEGNLYADPLFVDASNYNLELNGDSPCIDSGDPDLPLDEDLTRSDIGAYYSYSPDDYPFQIPGQYISQIKINEFLASNDATNSDESGEFDDWLELYNPSEEALDCSGLYLTDDFSNLTKWQFPEIGSVIEPGGYLLVWCDEQPDQGDLHSNFKLGAAGEELALVNHNGTSIIDSISFGLQLMDISYGRFPDGDNQWASMAPTPNSSNSTLDISSNGEIPERFLLEQNYPNPFNPATTIRFALPEAAHVSLLIYDLTGREVRILDAAQYPKGFHEISWNGQDRAGNLLASGVYLCRLEVESFSQTIKMVYLR